MSKDLAPTAGPASDEAATAQSAAAIDHDIDVIAKTISEGLVPRFEEAIRKVGDDLYGDILSAVQTYLTENVTDNLRSGLTYAQAYQRQHHAQATAADIRADGLLTALKRSAEGWTNAVELGLLLPQHMRTAAVLRDNANAAIAKAEGRS